jgi:hypothetical protein
MPERGTHLYLMVWGLVLVSATEGTTSLPEASYAIDDTAEVSWITTVISLLAVLSYLPMSITFSHASGSAGGRGFFTLGTLHPISRPFTNEGLAPMVANRWFCCNDMAHRLSLLLGQSYKWGVLRDHALD